MSNMSKTKKKSTKVLHSSAEKWEYGKNKTFFLFHDLLCFW